MKEISAENSSHRKSVEQRAIFITINSKFVPITRLFLNSLRRNYPNYPELLIHYTDLSSKDLELLRQYPRVKLISLDRFPDLATGPIMNGIGKIVDPRVFYSRLLIWTPMYEAYDKIMFMDVDILVLHDLEELWQHDFFIVQEPYSGEDNVFYDHNDVNLKKLIYEIGIDENIPRSNAGLFVISKKWRNAQEYSFLMQIITKFSSYIKWADQSVINIWMKARNIVPSKDLRFNFIHNQFQVGYDRAFLNKIRVIHFNGTHDNKKRMIYMKAANILFNLTRKVSFYADFLKFERRTMFFIRKFRKSAS